LVFWVRFIYIDHMNQILPNLRVASFLLGAMLLIVLGSSAQFITEKSADSTGIAEVEEQVMIITVYDGAVKQMIPADVSIKGLNPRKTVVFKNLTDTAFSFKNYRLYTISVVKKGYMYYAHKFWPAEAASHVEKINLEPLRLGLKADIEDITFLGDQTEVYHKSTPALEELLQFMTINESAKIRIIGHANGPESEKKGSGFYKKGSEKRAEAVRDYLIQHGIAADRLATKGAGNTEMIYPDPQTDWETQANRRIQIEIIGL
jgi:outer membrane protein OmpA-like peptidoglycan-associated protein